jgi:hypothetical protein
MSLKPIGGPNAGFGAGELSLTPGVEQTTTTTLETSLVPEAETLRGEQRLVGDLQARRLQSQLAPQGVETQTQGERVVEFRVPVPKSGDAREMRNAILKGPPFHYTDADILALEQSGAGEEFYISTQGNPERWATPAEVKNFSVTDGQTTIPVRESLVNSLVAFRARRRIEQATTGISDPALRRQVSEQLLTTLTGRDAAPRVGAAVNLSGLAAQDAAVSRALRLLAEDPAGRQSAALQLALGRRGVADELSRRAKFYGPYNDEADFADARTRLLDAVRLAGGDGAAVNREEAALVNRYASFAFREMGDGYNAAQREMVSRFYEADEQERRVASLTEWSTIPRWKPAPDGMNSVRPVTAEEERLRDFDDAFRASQQGPPSRDAALEKAKDIKRQQQAAIMNPGTRQRRVESSEDNGEVYVSRETTESQRQRNVELFRRRTGTMQPMVNPGGVRQGQSVAGAVDLVNTGLTYYTLYRKTQELERYQAERVPLAAAANRATRYPVPPRPEKVDEIETALRQQLAVTRDAQEHARLEETLRFIPTMREASRAFWNR